jgi:DNA-binding beta-propeller fold protein YncE
MGEKLFRSKPLTIAVIALFLVLLGAESYPQVGDQSQSEFQKILRAGKKLSEDGEHKEAITKLLQALTMAGNKDENAEACFYVSLAYYTLGERENCRTYLKRLFETQPAKEIDARMFPAGFVGLFNQAKTEVEKRQAPKPEEKPKAEEKKAEPEKKVEETKKVEPEKKTGEEKPPAGIGKGKQEIPTKKKSKLPWLIGGGVAVAGGVIALLLLKKEEPAGPQYGNIAITSQPSGAKVILDGNDTGQRSDCTLTNISAGTHALKLELENWGKWEGSALVRGGQTTNISAVLAGYTYELVTKWGTFGNGDGQFNSPCGVAVDGAGNVYVVDTGNTRIQKFGSNGTFIMKWGALGSGDSEFRRPWAAAVDGSGNIYIADTDNGRIKKFNSDGVFITKWGNKENGESGFQSNHGVAVDGSGYVYATEFQTSRIHKFTANGDFIKAWGSQGSGDGQFLNPMGIAVDRSNSIYITDNNNNRIQKFTSNGDFVAKWGSQGSGNGQFSYPQGIAWDSTDYIYVVDGNSRAQKFTPSGVYVAKWGTQGSGDGQFLNPMGITVDSSGFVYVTDADNHRIQKFRMSIQTMQPARITYTPIQTSFYRPGLVRPFGIFFIPARERAKEIPATAVRESAKKERIKEE